VGVLLIRIKWDGIAAFYPFRHLRCHLPQGRFRGGGLDFVKSMGVLIIRIKCDGIAAFYPFRHLRCHLPQGRFRGGDPDVTIGLVVEI
jgi:hypothetical protein